MFLRYFAFKKLPYTSSASRNVYYFKMSRLLIWKASHLSLKKKNNSGRNDSGRIVMRSQTSILSRLKNVQINYSFRYVKPSFVSHFQFLPFKNQILSLVHFSNGSLTYFLTTEKHKLFSLFFLTKIRRLKFFFGKILFNLLFKIKNATLISLIEILPGRGAQYCRSTGVVGKVLKFDFKNYLTLIKLPSGYRKSFSCYSFAAIGRVGIKQNRNFSNSKAGYWRKFGSKSIVRGVAMNPVDHPHGGRTKSIKYPRTPWGKTTKFK